VNDRTGWVVPAGDADALAAAVASALTSPDRDLIVRQAREAVAAAHDIRRNVVELEAALRRAHAGS
jgi:glycosyltransferase involved in cell wall biosynthesis